MKVSVRKMLEKGQNKQNENARRSGRAEAYNQIRSFGTFEYTVKYKSILFACKNLECKFMQS